MHDSTGGIRGGDKHCTRTRMKTSPCFSSPPRNTPRLVEDTNVCKFAELEPEVQATVLAFDIAIEMPRRTVPWLTLQAAGFDGSNCDGPGCLMNMRRACPPILPPRWSKSPSEFTVCDICAMK